MNQYIPLTAIDCPTPCLLIDRDAPLLVLHANAVERIRSATQLLESLAQHSNPPLDTLEQLNHAATVLLRDGCDLLDVLGWRLRGD